VVDGAPGRPDSQGEGNRREKQKSGKKGHTFRNLAIPSIN
jgi:hypothetical protein